MIDSMIWLSAFALSVSVLLLSRRAPRLSMLWAYCAFDVLRHALLFSQHSNPNQYFYAFWLTKLVEHLLKLALAVQLSRLALGRNRKTLLLLAPSGCALLLFAILRAGPPDSFQQMATLMQQSAFISGLVLFVAWLASVRFEQPYQMIAAGLGFNLTSQFVATIVPYPRLLPLCGVVTLATWLFSLSFSGCASRR